MICNIVVIAACLFTGFKLIYDGKMYKSPLEMTVGFILVVAVTIFTIVVFELVKL